MKKLSFAIFAASLALIPASLSAQEFDVPQNPPLILAPETVVVDPVEPAAEEPVVEAKKAKKEKKVKEPKVKEVKEPKVKKEKYYGFCNHLGIGASVGIMDGLSATVGIPLGGHLQLRGNYSIGVPDQVYPLQYTIPDLGTYNVSGKQVSLKDITLKGDLTKNLNVMADLYLSKKGGFHITIGIGGILDPKILSVSADLSKQLEQAFPGQDPSSLFIELNDDAANNKIRISTDKEGVLHLDMKDKQEKFRMYYGIGWGRVASIKSWLNLNLDLGVQQTNGFEVVGYNYDGQPQVFTSGLIDHKDKIASFEDLLDKAAAGDLPYLKGFMPVIRLGLTIRLF